MSVIDTNQLKSALERLCLVVPKRGFNTFLAQLSEKKIGLLRAIAQNDNDEFNPAHSSRNSPISVSHLLSEKGLLIRAGRGRYKLYHPLFRQFLQQQE